ncbi:hypothetical protein [Acetobacterium malicum]|uniref:hypothetical protein n=1 Tax=Acetobacterium malicum TaxID=52692 RepID=UPI0003FF2D60|nr:hypothetical protein [Acetobacterium dehalogenans]
MKNQEPQTVTYDERVNTTLAGLMEGKTREVLAEGFGLGGWKSLDIYMRRKGFVWDGSNNTYIPATNKADTILEELNSNTPVKADMIIRRFEEMGTDSEPRSIAREFGFNDHRELAEYMESKQLFWDSNKNNYGVMFGDASVDSVAETVDLENKTFQPMVKQQSKTGTLNDDSLMELEAYLPLLDILLQNKDRLITLLMPQSDGMIPRYTLPGKFNTQSIYMSDMLIRLLKEYCESKNLKQRDVVDVALIEFFRRYGYQREVDKLLQKK